VSEILRLRAGGYTYEAIREALADVGIELSTSALRREMRRSERQADHTGWATRPATRMPANARSPPLPPPPRLRPPASTSGREDAESFFNAHPSNPLLRTQEVP
jgi:transposase InsO family protein